MSFPSLPHASASAVSPNHKPDLESPAELLVDENIQRKFPQGAKVISAIPFGSSEWTVTARLHVRFVDGAEAQYFLKSAPNDHGRVLMEGEFNAMNELYKWAPDLAPEPHSFGQYAGHPATYFFLSQYIPMLDCMPDPESLCTKLARLHRDSTSPNGQFGFHTTTCQGHIAQCVGWQKDWTTFFIKLLQHVIDLDFETNGCWKDLDRLEKRLIEFVIPRLLDTLSNGGRSIKPSFIHGDLWEGNTGTSPDNGGLYLFDSAGFYAHHEMEVGDWRCYYNKIANPVYTQTYLRHVEPSEPKDEWEDRNRLYSVYYNVIYSVNHGSQGTAVRQLAYNDMYHLIDKFCPFPVGTGPPKLGQSQMAILSAERDHTLIQGPEDNISQPTSEKSQMKENRLAVLNNKKLEVKG